MNQRILILFAVVIILIGLCGLFLNVSSKDVGQPIPDSAKQPQTKKIKIAEAKREIKALEVIKASDYTLKEINVEKTKDDPRDVSSIADGELAGYISKSDIAEGSVITPDSIEPPKHAADYSHSLNKGEVAYDYIVKSQWSYLLNTLKPGDEVALYLKYIPTPAGGYNQSAVTVGELSQPVAKNSPNYQIKKIIGPLNVLRLEHFEKKETKSGYVKNPNIGIIVLRMNNEQMVKLMLVEKVGELIMLPATEGALPGNKLQLDSVLPHTQPIKQLRGVSKS